MRVLDFIKYRSKNVYREYVWERLPPGFSPGRYNGVDVGFISMRPFDNLVPFDTPSWRESYKEHSVEAVRESVREGDRVVCVGGGYGITPINSAFRCGESGRVIVYEPSIRRCDIIRENAHMNGVREIIHIETKGIGPVMAIGGEKRINEIDGTNGDSVVPECDVLEMDCEGAEYHILSEMSVIPRCIIVETHPSLEWSGYERPGELAELIGGMGYSVNEKGDGKVLVAKIKREEL